MERKVEEGRRRPAELRPEFVALGLLAEGPAHGYELMRRFKASLDGLWHISESQFYSTLKRLEARGLVEAAAPERGEGAARRLLSLAPGGRRSLDEWLDTPTLGSPKLLHLEFLTRLSFARRLSPRRIPGMVKRQVASLRKELARVEALLDGAPGDELAELSIRFREGQLRAALIWIEEEVEPSIKAGGASFTLPHPRV